MVFDLREVLQFGAWRAGGPPQAGGLPHGWKGAIEV
jgi:hypothetical protein